MSGAFSEDVLIQQSAADLLKDELLENFILFDHSGGHTVKIMARKMQWKKPI